MAVVVENYVGGAFVAAAPGAPTIEAVNPATAAVIGSLPGAASRTTPRDSCRRRLGTRRGGQPRADSPRPPPDSDAGVVDAAVAAATAAFPACVRALRAGGCLRGQERENEREKERESASEREACCCCCS